MRLHCQLHTQIIPSTLLHHPAMKDSNGIHVICKQESYCTIPGIGELFWYCSIGGLTELFCCSKGNSTNLKDVANFPCYSRKAQLNLGHCNNRCSNESLSCYRYGISVCDGWSQIMCVRTFVVYYCTVIHIVRYHIILFLRIVALFYSSFVLLESLVATCHESVEVMACVWNWWCTIIDIYTS